ncbi:MAG: FGGY family carbohydrate kinase, partial [Gammaproteobacteria bacterium]|nr:FGGY family carbohydrate kinase [Gammaproteobacteria bacterium]
MFLGIDFGTSGCRAAVINAQGELVTLCKEDLPAPVIKGSSVSQDVEIWRSGLTQLINKVSEKVALEDIAAIAIDGTSGSVLLCDEQGKETGPALMYNDASGSEIAAEIKNIAPENSGAHGASSGLAKLAVLYDKLKSNTPVYATTQAGWLSGLLTGNFTFIDENNALKLG